MFDRAKLCVYAACLWGAFDTVPNSLPLCGGHWKIISIYYARGIWEQQLKLPASHHHVVGIFCCVWPSDFRAWCTKEWKVKEENLLLSDEGQIYDINSVPPSHRTHNAPYAVQVRNVHVFHVQPDMRLVSRQGSSGGWRAVKVLSCGVIFKAPHSHSLTRSYQLRFRG